MREQEKKQGRRRCWFKINEVTRKIDALRAARQEIRDRNVLGLKKPVLVMLSLPRKGDIAYYVNPVEHVEILKKTYRVTPAK